MSELGTETVLQVAARAALESAQRLISESVIEEHGKPTIVVAIAFPGGDFQYTSEGGVHSAAGVMRQCEKKLMERNT